MRECGLKFRHDHIKVLQYAVTPCAGVWIEIVFLGVDPIKEIVTPCAGVWIEINASLNNVCLDVVTPCAGVWIEIVL